MKKVLKILLIVLSLIALTVSVYAESATAKTVENKSGADELVKITTTASSDITVNVVAPTSAASNESTAKALADKTGTKVMAVLNSFDINVKKGTMILHSGVNVDITIKVPNEYVGMYLNIFETSGGETSVTYSKKITTTSMTISLNSFSTFTPVVTSGSLNTANSPQNGQAIIPYALIALALVSFAGFVLVAKYNNKLQ